MFPRLLRSAAPLLAVTVVGTTAYAQAPARKPAAPTVNQFANEQGVPVSQTMQSLEAKLQAMLNGTSGLTADEVAKRAADTSPEVAAKQRAIEAAEAKESQAVNQFLPKLTGTARYTRLSEIDPVQIAPGVFINAGIPNNYLAQATLAVPISDYLLRLSKATGAAKKSRLAAELDERASRLKVAADARISYYQWIRAQGALLVAQQAAEQARGHRVDAQHAFEVGMVSKADVLRAESQLKTAELAVERFVHSVRLAEEQLRVVMHDGSGKPYEIGENIILPLEKVPGVDTPDSLNKEALQKRLEIRALDETEYAIRETVKLQRAGNYPRLDAQANAIYANPNQRVFPLKEEFRGTWDASIVLTWSPTDIPLNNANARETEAKAAQIEAQKTGLRDALRLEVTQAMNAVQEAEFAIESTHAGLVASEESYRVRRDLYRNGRATSVELTDAETDLTRARLEAVNARIDARIARVRLFHAVGRDVTPPKG